MHRSGTSLLARLLAAEGLPLGSTLLNRRSRDNAHGCREQAEIVQVHEALLDGLDRTCTGRTGAGRCPRPVSRQPSSPRQHPSVWWRLAKRPHPNGED